VVLLLVLATVGVWAAEPVTVFNDESGFETLFNGKDLTGWDGDPRLWFVHEGAIRGQTTADNRARSNSFLVWQGGELGNFVLKVKFRIQNGNSGIQYRSRALPNWVVSGYQAEVDNKPGHVGFLYHEKGRASLVQVGDMVLVDGKGKKNVVGQVADAEALKEAGYCRVRDWNEYAIICRGNHIVHYLNGHQTIEMIDEDFKGRLLQGQLALQIHTGPPMIVDFKDIRIKRLVENYGNTVQLFNGKDLQGWTFSSPGNKQAWGAKDGVLTNTGRPRGYLCTEKEYTNYVLRLQMRHLAKGNCGVLLRKVGPDKVWPRSIEAQGQYRAMGDIWNIDKFPMKVDLSRTRGRHTRKLHPTNEKEVGGWNEYEIYLNKGELRIYVNGLLQNTATECWETPGKICLQSEGSPVEFRNIVLLPIRDQGLDAGWIPLFDGESLSGWTASENKNSFKVQDGQIVVHGPRSHLFYTGPVMNHSFRDFEFKAEVMTRPGANSGMYFHTEYQENGWPSKGYEVQVNNSHSDRIRTSSLYGIQNVMDDSPASDNQWFTQHITVEGQRMVVRVNGKVVNEYDNCKPGQGTFALQGHDPKSVVFYKNVMVRPLYTPAFPLVDYHVHLKGGLTLAEAKQLSRARGIKFGIAENCGKGFKTTDDAGLRIFLDKMQGQPVYAAMQAEGREWIKMFSKSMIAKFDYAFTDSMTFTDDKGRRMRLWMPNEVFVDEAQSFMDMLVRKTVGILSNEPIDIYVNPTFLPAKIAEQYDLLWTEERMDKVIAAAVENDVAIEINARYGLPSIKFIKRAQEAGATFAFGTNNGNRDLGHLEYCRRVAQICGLTEEDMFVPKSARAR